MRAGPVGLSLRAVEPDGEVRRRRRDRRQLRGARPRRFRSAKRQGGGARAAPDLCAATDRQLDDHDRLADLDAARTCNRRTAQVKAAFIRTDRSEEHTSELQSLMRISYAVFCLKKKKSKQINY